MDLQYAYRKRHKNAYMVQHHLDPKIIAEQPEETWLRPAECRLGNLSLKRSKKLLWMWNLLTSSTY